MSDKKADEFKFYVIQNGSFLSSEARALRNKLFEAYCPLWTDIYKDHGSSTVPSFQGFRNFEFLHCLTLNNEIAGFSAHRFIDSRDELSKHLEYFQVLGDENLQKIQNLGVQKIMTFEALFIPEAHRKSRTSLPTSKLLFYLANKSFSISPADGMVGAARIEVKVPLLSKALGYRLIEGHRVMRNIPCDVVLQLNRDVFHPGEEAWHQSQQLWDQRVIFRSEDPFTNVRSEQRKQAA